MPSTDTQEQQTIRLDLRGEDRVEFVGTVTNVRLEPGIAYARIPDRSVGRVEFEGRTYRVTRQHIPEWPSDLWYYGEIPDFEDGEEDDEH